MKGFETLAAGYMEGFLGLGSFGWLSNWIRDGGAGMIEGAYSESPKATPTDLEHS